MVFSHSIVQGWLRLAGAGRNTEHRAYDLLGPA